MKLIFDSKIIIYIYIYLYLYIYIYIFIYLYIFIYINIYTYTYTCIDILYKKLIYYLMFLFIENFLTNDIKIKYF